MRAALSRLALSVVSLTLAAGCAASGGVSPWIDVGNDPWRLPATAYPTQRLFRVKYDGPQGHLGFKLTVYLQGETRFRMRAADGLGRRIWELAVDENDEALWLDHRNEQYCVAASASRLAIVPLARLPLVSLPKLLLGLLPAAPASGLERDAASVRYRDRRGQLWQGGLAGGRLEWWNLAAAGDDEPAAWWRREGDESVFVDRRGEQQLRWREVVRETLVQPPAPLAIPEKYDQADCG